jgi:hypothetical protein
MILGTRLRATHALAAALASVAVGGVGVAAASDRTQSSSGRTVDRPDRGSEARAKVRALVSTRGPKAGSYVARPSRLTVIYGYRSDVAASHLKWVDWGQPVAFASGDILIQTSTGGFESVRGALVLDGLIACGANPTYYYKSATAYTPTYPKYAAVSTGRPQLASPC